MKEKKTTATTTTTTTTKIKIKKLIKKYETFMIKDPLVTL